MTSITHCPAITVASNTQCPVLQQVQKIDPEFEINIPNILGLEFCVTARQEFSSTFSRWFVVIEKLPQDSSRDHREFY